MSESESSRDIGLESQDEESQRQQQIKSLDRDFSAYTHDANLSTYLKLVHDRTEAEENIRSKTFHPDFVHQFFGNKEAIFGYKKPVLKLFYSASQLKRYISFDYEDKLTREKDGIEADNVMASLRPILEDISYTSNLDQFIKDIESDDEKSFRPPGDLLQEFEIPFKEKPLLCRAQLEQEQMGQDNEQNSNGSKENGGGDANVESRGSDVIHPNDIIKKKFQIYKADKEKKGFMQFQKRMQSFVMWFIDAANMIDVEDPRWDIFLVFENCNPSVDDKFKIESENRLYFVGYATVYRYYAYPDKTRPRVSQMLLLPPYRRNGIGTNLLQCIYNWYKEQPETLDITAEDPAEEFIAMRDYLDCKNCRALETYQPDKLMQGWSDDKAKEAQEKLRVCERQARKVYEILKLMILNTENPEEYRKYRIEIKNRLNGPNQRLKLDCEKLIKKGYELPEEMKVRRDAFRYAILEENYQELERQYSNVIDKLKRLS